jgi:hypothetical protein
LRWTREGLCCPNHPWVNILVILSLQRSKQTNKCYVTCSNVIEAPTSLSIPYILLQGLEP